MSTPVAFAPWLAEVERLSTRGVVNLCEAFEVTEVVAFIEGARTPRNVLSLIVAGDQAPAAPFASAALPQALTAKRITLTGLKTWRFGLFRYALRPGDLVDALQALAAGRGWAPSGPALEVGDLEPLGRVFAPADGMKPRAINGVLKNNFWAGSHVMELSDTDKSALAPLLEKPARLQELSEAIEPICPIQIARASDRLGNILIQFPVTAVMAELQAEPPTGSLVLDLTWRPGIAPRSLRLAVERRFDGLSVADHSATVAAGRTAIPVGNTPGLESATLWDDELGLMLWRQAPVSRIRQIHTSVHARRPEPRMFRHSDDAEVVSVQVGDAEHLMVGGSERQDQEAWTRRRIYALERAQLRRERRFVQYIPTTPASIAHEAALADLRSLIATFGVKATWLWDPYLSAEDILKTLFHSPHAGAELRALSDAQSVPRTSPAAGGRGEGVDAAPAPNAPRPTFADLQRARLIACAGNMEGLRLEYRARIGHNGWSFHDRFLIFPQTDQGPLAWSLGTSVNMLGHKHHILQRVGDGRLVADAFEQLWNELSRPRNLIWKSP